MRHFALIALISPVWLGVFAWPPSDLAAQTSSHAKRAAAVEDSVRLRTFVDQEPVAVSADGRWVAYVLVEPDLAKNCNETVLYVRALPQVDEKHPPRDLGRAVLRTLGIHQMQWLADSQHLLVLHRPDGTRGRLVQVARESGVYSPVSPADLDVQSFAATPDGRRLAMLVNVPDGEQADRFAAPRGVVITEDDFLLDVDSRSTARKQASLTAVFAADTGGGKMTVFAGKRSLDLMQPAISPDGRYLTFLALGEALPYPKTWQRDPAFSQWPQRGFVVPQSELVLAQLPAKMLPTPPSGSSASEPKLRLALDAGCIADYLWQMPALWSDNSACYLICGPTPVGANSTLNEPLIGPLRPQHLFAVDVKTGAVQQVMDETPEQMLTFDQQASRIVLLLRSGELVTLRRSADTPGKWRQVARTRLPGADLRNLSPMAGDMRRFVGIHQSTTVPPDLWLLDVPTSRKTVLTQINPELNGQTLGRVENISWTGSNDARHRGYLIYPVDYNPGTRYPCVILCKDWDDTFIHGGNAGYSSNFAPQVLANSGFVVLMLTSEVGPYPKGTWEHLPGGISEAFRAMDALETARRELDRRGLIDPTRVGIMGFSRTSWTVDFTITHSRETWAAAVSADSGIYNYGTYLGNKNLRSGMAAMYGGPASGESRKAWLDYAPAFSAGRVRTPLLMQYHGRVSMAAEFYSALVTQGKPVELVLFPEGKHILELPLQRLGSMQGSVDWFHFWLKGYENPKPQYAGQYAHWRKLRALHEQNEQLIAAGKDPSAEFIRRERDKKD